MFRQTQLDFAHDPICAIPVGDCEMILDLWQCLGCEPFGVAVSVQQPVTTDSRPCGGKRSDAVADDRPFRSIDFSKFCRSGTLHAGRCELEGPGEEQSDRKTEYDNNRDECDRPSGQLQLGENDRGYLNQNPADHSVGSCDLEQLAAFQLCPERHMHSPHEVLANILAGLVA